jgi:hypothetical protein
MRAREDTPVKHASAVAAVLCLTFAASAHAGGTRFWELNTSAQFSEGKLEGAIVGSRGEVTAGCATTRRATKVDAIWCLLADGRGGVLAGTGSKGQILKLAGGEVTEFASTGQTAVTVMRRAADGIVVGSIPEGKLLLLDDAGTVSPLVSLEARYIWDIAVSPGGTIYAATGPDGKLFRIEGGTAELWWKSDEQNLLSVALTPGGALYVGSGEKGLLYRVTGKNEAVVVYDFDESEVRSIVVGEDSLLVAANAAKSKGGTSQPAAETKEVAPAEKKDAPPPPSKEPMDCAVYRLAADGNVEPLFASKGEFIWNLAAVAGERFVVATGDRGRIYRGKLPQARDGLVVEGETSDVLFDLDEGQALALAVEFGELTYVGTGNGAAVYELSPKTAGKGLFTSKVLDAKRVASWGRLEWQARGSVTITTRSGATAEPNDTWNPWTPLNAGGEITSPRARYLQFRADVSARDAALTEIRIAYLPDNQRPTVESFGLVVDSKAKAGKDEKRDPAELPLPAQRTELPLKWVAKDADGDTLVYRLSYKLVGEPDDSFRSLGTGDPIAGDKYEWETRGLPDGRYVVRVVASDERDNPTSHARSVARDSDPILVDHTQPVIEAVEVNDGMVAGIARDSASRIAHLSWILDGLRAQLLTSTDGLLDSMREEFAFELPKGLPRGLHTLAIRCADEAGNLTVTRMTFIVA